MRPSSNVDLAFATETLASYFDRIEYNSGVSGHCFSPFWHIEIIFFASFPSVQELPKLFVDVLKSPISNRTDATHTFPPFPPVLFRPSSKMLRALSARPNLLKCKATVMYKFSFAGAFFQ